jgi:hypothetical protein
MFQKPSCIRSGARFANKRLELVGRYAPPQAGKPCQKVKFLERAKPNYYAFGL